MVLLWPVLELQYLGYSPKYSTSSIYPPDKSGVSSLTAPVSPLWRTARKQEGRLLPSPPSVLHQPCQPSHCHQRPGWSTQTRYTAVPEMHEATLLKCTRLTFKYLNVCDFYMWWWQLWAWVTACFDFSSLTWLCGCVVGGVCVDGCDIHDNSTTCKWKMLLHVWVLPGIYKHLLLCYHDLLPHYVML